MKIAFLLPGYLDSPDYLHFKTFEKRLKEIGYVVERLDPCNVWKTGDTAKYSVTNYLKQIEDRVSCYKSQSPEDVILIGHSLGGFMAIIAGNRIPEVTRIVSLCPPPDLTLAETKWVNKTSRHSKRDLPDDPQNFRMFDVPYSFARDGLCYSAMEDIKLIHKPLMIFIADNDTSVPPDLTEKLANNANSPYLVRESNMGHDFRHSQKECEVVFEQIKKFITDSS